MNYRPFLKEMLSDLKQDFEIILFGSNYQYVDKIVETLVKDGEPLFDYVIKKEMLVYTKNIDYYILDLNILLGSRELKDIIVVSNTCGRSMLHYANSIPVKEYTGNKKDLSLYSLTKYIRSFKDVKDVRTRITEDFGM